MTHCTDRKGQSQATRLRDYAKGRGVNTSVLQTRYAQAAALRRLVESDRDAFVLKGGLLHLVDVGDAARPTSDIDIHAKAGGSKPLALRAAEALALDLDDGIRFELTDLQELRVSEEDAGWRVNAVGWMGEVRVGFHIDVAAGGAPCAVEWRTFPAVAKGSVAFEVPCQPWTSVLADKLRALAAFGADNTRVRDFADIARLMVREDLDQVASETLRGFEGRDMELPDAGLPGLTTAFAASRQGMWEKWKRKSMAQGLPDNFGDVVSAIAPWVEEVMDRARALETGRAFR